MMTRQSQYLHGGAPQRDMARLGVPLRPVLDFSVNLNPLGPPPVIQERWQELFEAVEHYPSIEGEGVALYYETVCNVSSRNFLAGNGSTEMIYHAPRVLGFKRAAVITPSYHDYERASLLAGAEVVRCPLSPADDFAFPPENELVGLLNHVDALWIARPNNPTGNVFPKDVILRLARRFPQKWFMVDEAFIQFLSDWKTNSLLTETPLPNILVLHSLTKFFAIAGLRLGGVIGSEPVISRLKKAKEPWAVNGIADRVASLLTECPDYEDDTRTSVQQECRRVFGGLQSLDGIVPYPASADYILCRWVKTGNLDDMIRHLLSHGAYVRDCRNFPGLEDNFFRIGLKKPADNDLLLSLLASFQPSQPGL
ncbi:MAG: pyridoxal phosphate-dependent class II aminotransferase [Deltaproteobacteria bacterium]|nr:pyridoxal phosphate-dependent class II aminotransferase [Deltaproteobacteria bacterium]